MSADEYRGAMDALARETTMAPESATRIERYLLDAFESRDAADGAHTPAVKSVWTWRPWIYAAAAIVLVVGVGYVWWADQPPVNVGRQKAQPTVAEHVPAAPPTVESTVDRSSSVEVKTAHPPTPKRKPAKNTNVVTPSGFVDLPWTAGLPAFESGEIVRMEIPAASLPTYGIDISPGAGRGPVKADVLIGQDGFARQIRLVTTSSRSTQ